MGARTTGRVGKQMGSNVKEHAGARGRNGVVWKKRDPRMEVYIGKVVCSASHVANMQMCCDVLRVLCAMRRCGMACGT